MATAALEKVIIPQGSFLYRVADKVCVYTLSNIKCTTRKCSDTGKRGVYFANYILMSLAMATEYGRNMQLGVFITTRDITIYKGKYSYRNILPGEPEENSALSKRQIGHFNDEILPLLYNNNGNDKNIDRVLNEGEIFITSPHDLANIKLLATYTLNTTKLQAIIKDMEAEEIPRHDINFYIRMGILTRFHCNKSKSYKRRNRQGSA